MRAVLYLPTDDRDLIPGLEIVLRIAAPEHNGRAMDFDHPFLGFALGIHHVQVEVNVRILPLKALDSTFQSGWLAHVEHGSRVMPEGRCRQSHDEETSNQEHDFRFHSISVE